MSFRNIRLLVGNQFGVDHSYWRLLRQTPPVPSSDSDLQFNSVGVDLQKYMDWSWRIREMTVTGGNLTLFLRLSAAARLATSDPMHPFANFVLHPTYNFSWNFAPQSASIPGALSDKELSLIIEQLGDFPFLGNSGIFANAVATVTRSKTEDSQTAFGVTATTVSTFVSNPGSRIFQMGSALGQPAYINAGIFYPFLFLSISASTRIHIHVPNNFFPDDPDSINRFSATNGLNGSPFGISRANATVDSEPLIHLRSDFPNNADTIWTLNDVAAVRKSYWQYRNTLNQQVYDAASGAQLNNPFA